MFKLLVLIGAFVTIVQCGFFDIADVEDSFHSFWKWAEKRKEPAQCVIDLLKKKYGMCMEIDKCKLKGGIPHQKCGILYTCCFIPKPHGSCNQVSDEKQSYFDSSDYDPSITHCNYQIKLRNKNVCQVRNNIKFDVDYGIFQSWRAVLDFEEMIFEGTEEGSPVASQLVTPYQNYEGGQILTDTTNGYVEYCNVDKLLITPNSYGIPKILCGNNNGQHVYVHINQTEDGINAVTIDIFLRRRLNQGSTDFEVKTPSWRIAFNQLECPVKTTKFDLTKYKQIDTIAEDFNNLAPLGVIQYHTNTSGQIRSFGYGGTDDSVYSSESYPYNEKYVIGFRRPSQSCAIQFTVDYLDLLQDTTSANNPKPCTHYLYVPEVADNSDNEKICSKNANSMFYSTAPGPYLLYFDATGTPMNSHGTTKGFQLNYDVLGPC